MIDSREGQGCVYVVEEGAAPDALKDFLFGDGRAHVGGRIGGL
jgi:hypothetical protein